MNPQATGVGYDKIAERWRSDEFPAENGLPQHQRALAFCENREFALDVGCGANPRIPRLLMEAGFSAVGVDVSQEMLVHARAHNLYDEYVHADICTWTPPRNYDLITAWDSIWHVPLQQQDALMRKLVGCLTAGGVMIFSMGGLATAEEKTDRVMGPTMYYATLGVPATLELLAEEGALLKHFEFDQHPESHAYMIVQVE